MSFQVVIGLCKRRETAAFEIKPPFHGCVEICLLYDGFFSFAVVRQIVLSFSFPHRSILEICVRKFDYSNFRAIVETDRNNTVTLIVYLKV